MRINSADITRFPDYNKAIVSTMVASKKLKPTTKSPLRAKLIAAWLKLDPFVSIIAKDNQRIRHDAMLALAGKNAAKEYFGKFKKLKPPPKLIFPQDVREKEIEFLQKPKRRSLIIRELVYWGRDDYLNQENPDSYLSRIQIISSLLGPILLNASEEQEKLLVDGVKVLVISKQTTLGKKGEQSIEVHRALIHKVVQLLKYNQMVIDGEHNQQTESAVRAQLIKTIQNLSQQKHRSAYYVAGDQLTRKKIIKSKFPLKETTKSGLIDIVKHYSFSANTQFQKLARETLTQIGERESDE